MPHRTIPYLLFRFFQDFALVYPVYMIFFEVSGLDYRQIGYLLAIWALAVVVLEVPSGLVSDLWSRRGTLAIAMVLKAAGFLVWLVRPDFAGFAWGFVLWGAQEALTSGTTDALLFDALRRERAEDRFVEISGKGAMAARIGIMASVLLGGWVFSRSVPTVFILSAVSMIVAAVCPLFLSGESHERSDHVHRSPRELAGEIVATVRAARTVPGIVPLVLFGSLAFATYGVLDEYDFLFGLHHGVPVALVGLWGGARFLLEGVGGVLAYRFERIFRLDRPARLAGWVCVGGVILAAGVATGRVWLLPLYFIFYMFMAAGEVLYQGRLQERIESTGRATVSSIVSFVYTVFGIAVVLVFGSVSQRFGLEMLMISGAAIVTITAIVYGIFGRKRFTQQRP